jgi:hypothetical protein
LQQAVKHRGGAVALELVVAGDAGKRRKCVLANNLLVVDADDGNLLRNFEFDLPAGVEGLPGSVIGDGEQAAGRRQLRQLS